MLRACGLTALLVLALAGPCQAASGSAGATVPPYGTNDYGGFRNVLPPGQNGFDNALQLGQFETSGAHPPHNNDQLGMYEDLLYAAPITESQVSAYYKDATFGVKPGDVASQESPEPGVTILRDRQYGVPHIYGDTRAELMFGIGYATAEDRLFFIDVLRHLGRAELTSFAGGAPGNRAFDAEQWSVAPYTEQDLQKQVDQGVALASGPLGQRTSAGAQAGAVAQQILQDSGDFIDGINAYIDAAKLDPNLMPAEYAAIGQPQGPTPFGLTDLVSIASLVGGIFGTGGGEQLPWAQLLEGFQQRFGAAAGYQDWIDLRSLDDPEAPTTVHGSRFPYMSTIPRHVATNSVAMPDPGTVTYPQVQTVTGGGTSSSASTSTLQASDGGSSPGALSGLLALPHEESNALLVSAAKSDSGHPLAVFGPQVGYFSPEILMEEDIHGPGIDAEGVAFPGVNQYVQLGHGRDYAWSATSGEQDITDTFALALCNPGGGPVTKDSDYYVWQGQCQPMQLLQRVNSWTPNAADQTPAGSETLTIYRTVLGLVEARATIGGKPVAYVLDRSTYGHELDSALGFEEFNDPGFVQDARSFQRAAYDIGFTFNWFYVDSRDIAYFNAGEDPVRAPNTNPLLPVWGNYTWEGFDSSNNTADYIPFDQHPQAIDQEYFTSWNNKPAPGYDDTDYGPVFRSQLLDDSLVPQLAGKGKIDLAQLVNDMENAATVDLRGSAVLPYALRIIGQPSDPALSSAVSELQGWVAAGAHRKAPAAGQPYDDATAIRIMDAWWPLLVQAVFSPTMGQSLYQLFVDPPGQSNEPPGAAEEDNTPNNQGQHLGSAWDTTIYGHVQKDLRQVLGLPVADPDHEVYCGGGNLTACKAALQSSLAQAVAIPAAQVYPADGSCSAGDQTCFDDILFRPVGAITQPLIGWQNRPTFQQADEISGHRPFPSEPSCIYANLPMIATSVARASRHGRVVIKGSAQPRDCGPPSGHLVDVSVAISRRAGRGCRFLGPRGHPSRVRSCDRPLYVRARGTAHWAVHLPRVAARGRYRVSAIVTDLSGDVASAPTRGVSVR